MQPETVTKTKDNLEVSRENKKEISPILQWDQVAFKLIQDVLAPKGYKQIHSGKWRGLRIANAEQPGIVKSKVNQCQKIAAQMVRAYRESVKARVEAQK